jgi:serine/threonine protein kinase
MSPEIAGHKPYNQATDVYSFGIVLYEIVSLSRPMRKDNSQIRNASNLKLDGECPRLILQTIQSSLSSVLDERPTMEEVLADLNLAVAHLESVTTQIP